MVKNSDFRNSFDIHPINGDILLVTEEQAISNQIKNLIFTDHYEVFWKPTVGAGVPQTLFDNFGPDSEYLIKNRITETINKYVKRAKLLDVIVTYDGNNGYRANIIYRPLNQLDPVTLTTLITRTR